MRQHRIQVIHCNEHNIYPFAALLRFVTRCPLACHVRYLVSREYAQWAFGGRRRRPDALLWTSRQQRMDCAEAIRGVVPEECQHLVPLGLDPALYGSRQSDRDRVRAGWGVEPGDVVIGQATALRPRKRIEDFIELIARLAEEDSRVVGVLAGDAPPGDEAYRAEVLKHIQRRQLGRRFQWIGHIDDVEPFDHALDVFVSTSEYETFGNSVCEAMACARPVVAYQGGSVKEIVGDSGIIVDNGDLPALTNAVRECVRRPELRATLGRAGLHRVLNEFSPTSTLAQLCVIYEKLLRERPDSIGGPP
jgi:glycosyltransferase involved in cell wall biosynthesis